MTEVDLFVSTQRIKVLTADTQVSGEWEHLHSFGAAETFLFGLGISALHPRRWGRAQGWPTGEDTRLGGDVTLQPSHAGVSCPSALCMAARGFSCKLRLAGAAGFPDQAPGNLGLKFL